MKIDLCAMKSMILIFMIMAIAILSGCTTIKRGLDQEDAQKIWDLGHNSAHKEINDWCKFNCSLNVICHPNRYQLITASGGSGDVIVSFSFDDENAAVYPEDNSTGVNIANKKWMKYAVAGSDIYWYFDIFADFDKNITISILKNLEPFPKCMNCDFQQITRKKTFTLDNFDDGFLQ